MRQSPSNHSSSISESDSQGHSKYYAHTNRQSTHENKEWYPQIPVDFIDVGSDQQPLKYGVSTANDSSSSSLVSSGILSVQHTFASNPYVLQDIIRADSQHSLPQSTQSDASAISSTRSLRDRWYGWICPKFQGFQKIIPNRRGLWRYDAIARQHPDGEDNRQEGGFVAFDHDATASLVGCNRYDVASLVPTVADFEDTCTRLSGDESSYHNDTDYEWAFAIEEPSSNIDALFHQNEDINTIGDANKNLDMGRRSGFLNFSASLIGSVLLLMPHVHKECGSMQAITICFFAAFLCSIAFVLLGYCVTQYCRSLRAAKRTVCIGALAEIYGGLGLRIITALLELFICLGPAISAFILSGEFALDFAEHALPEQISSKLTRRLMSAIIFMSAMVPLVRVKTPGLLKYSSFASIATAIFTIIVMKLFHSSSGFYPCADDPCFEASGFTDGTCCIVPMPSSDAQIVVDEIDVLTGDAVVEVSSVYLFLNVLAFQMVAFAEVPQLCGIFNGSRPELQNLKSLSMMIVPGIFTVATILSVYGYLGFQTFQASTNEVVLELLPSSYAIVVMNRAIYTVVMIGLFALMTQPAKHAIFDIFLTSGRYFGVDLLTEAGGIGHSVKRFDVVTSISLFLFLFIVLICGVMFDSIEVVFHVVGQFGSPILGFVLPSFCFGKEVLTARKEGLPLDKAKKIGLVASCVLGFIGSALFIFFAGNLFLY